MELNKYFIHSIHNVCIDDFIDGETNEVNYYNMEETIEADSVWLAIKKYIEKILSYNIEMENISLYDDDEKIQNIVEFSVTTNTENSQASEYEIEAWKKGDITLYSDNVRLIINQIVPVIITKYTKEDE